MQVGCSEFLPLQFVRRLLNFRAPEDEFSSDDEPDSKLDDELEEIGEDNVPTEIPESCEAQNKGFTAVSELQSDKFINMAESAVENSSLSMQSETPHQQFVSDHEYRFQEIVPLIACNVVCVEDEAPIPIWEGLICHTLNNKMQVFKANDPLKSCKDPSTLSHCAECIHHVPEMYDGEDEVSALLQHSQHLPNTRVLHPEKAQINHLYSKQNSSEDETLLAHAGEDSTSIEWPPGAVREDDKESATFAPSISSTSTMFSSPCRHNRFLRIVSKQMVGIYITIWIRSDLRHHVHDIKVCSVGCGIFNYLGNKGAVSVSLCLHQTSFCFVCTHLKSGLKEGDELRRNADVAEILHRTKFPRLIKQPGIELPKTIMTHDQIIWLGDLNYRIDATDEDTWALVDQGAWECLLQKDQLKVEQRAGHVFEGWHENPICFPPTYKFIINSDEYFGRDTPLGAKRRTPAWCDRILWYGKGLRQLEYKHIESQLSDHRPVSSTFVAEVEIASHERLKPTFCRNSKVEVEELRPTTLITISHNIPVL
ncbi:hypothetical protein CY35_01G113100 [Sphagnum magellanicum]|nr:hypothetical protein CY35_01G113100 [Sphagnum magellanicum]